ncbi:MAG: hypothetical protein VYE68_00075 [Acidobacteriota bacterium]|nr:hypothetical protein [Acidobacteriota bacterium]
MTATGPYVGGTSVLGLVAMLTVPGFASLLEVSAATPENGAIRKSASSLVGVRCRGTVLPHPNPPYHAIDMVKTGRVPGTGRSKGVGHASFARSPFGIAVRPDGTYVYDLKVTFERLKAPKKGYYTLWITTPEIDQVTRLGVLDEHSSVSGRVDWNKYLVVLTLEPENKPEAPIWSGPIVSRGVSRSGLMHTLAGHGPYENEPCARYGFGDTPGRGIGTR